MNQIPQIKEIIIDNGFDFENVIELEKLILNFFSWKLENISPNEFFDIFCLILNLNPIEKQSLYELYNDAVYYFLSDEKIFLSYDTGILSVTAFKIILNLSNFPNIYIFENYISNFIISNINYLNTRNDVFDFQSFGNNIKNCVKDTIFLINCDE